MRKLRDLLVTGILVRVEKVKLTKSNFLIGEQGEAFMKEKVEKALEKIRPVLQADGGDVESVDVRDEIVSVKLTGAWGAVPCHK